MPAARDKLLLGESKREEGLARLGSAKRVQMAHEATKLFEHQRDALHPMSVLVRDFAGRIVEDVDVLAV